MIPRVSFYDLCIYYGVLVFVTLMKTIIDALIEGLLNILIIYRYHLFLFTAKPSFIPLHFRLFNDVCTILQPATPPVIKKFLNTTRPEVGAPRVFYGKAGDADIASALRHGVRTKASVNVSSHKRE